MHCDLRKYMQIDSALQCVALSEPTYECILRVNTKMKFMCISVGETTTEGFRNQSLIGYT